MYTRKLTKSRKAGSDDLILIAGSLASSQGGKPPKSHSATPRKWGNGRKRKERAYPSMSNLVKHFPSNGIIN